MTSSVAEGAVVRRSLAERRRTVVILTALFVGSRVVLLALSLQPQWYPSPSVDASWDICVYQGWGEELRGAPEGAYADVAVEYPPAALPFLVAPAAVSGPAESGPGPSPCDEVLSGPDTAIGHSGAYGTVFVLTMMVVDVACFVALALMVRRGASRWGPALWIVGPLLLGPVVYLRFDLVPALAILLAVERAHAGRWGGTGGFLGWGTAAKLFPLFLLPLAWIIAPRDRRGRVVGWFAAVGLLFALPFLGAVPELVDSVLAFHGDRGVQFESSWAAGLFLARRLGYTVEIVEGFGGIEVDAGAVPLLKALSNALALMVWAGAVGFTARFARRANAGDLALASLGTLALLTAVGRVYSPQYVVWLLAAAAAAVAIDPGRGRRPAIWLLLVAALTHLVYPVLPREILGGSGLAVFVLVLRDGLTLGVGLLALVAVSRRTPPKERDVAVVAARSHQSGG